MLTHYDLRTCAFGHVELPTDHQYDDKIFITSNLIIIINLDGMIQVCCPQAYAYFPFKCIFIIYKTKRMLRKRSMFFFFDERTKTYAAQLNGRVTDPKVNVFEILIIV